MDESQSRIPEPGPDDNPTLGGASSLEYYEKALSYYMPNKLFLDEKRFPRQGTYKIYSGKWTNQESEKKETWKQGKRSSARRPFEPAEFEQTLDMCNDLDGIEKKYMIPPACCKFQYTMVASLDDSCRLEKQVCLFVWSQTPSFHSHYFVECAVSRMF